MSDVEAILRWYLTLTTVAAGLLPAVAWLGVGLGTSRVALLRPVGLAVLTGLVWWPAAAVGLPFSRTSLAVVLLLASMVGWSLWVRSGAWRQLSIRALLAYEGVWLGAFLLYAWFRGFHPDIAYTEKPMEIALLSSIVRSTDVPAPDPWLAGHAINYYYFGYQTIAGIVKLSGVPATIGFNLALATLFASCAAVAAGIGAHLVRRAGGAIRSMVVAGTLSPVLLLLAGNLETSRRLARDWGSTVDAGWWDGVGWQASRVIADVNARWPNPTRETINEFPAFTFVLGDLHPHVLTYPLLASVVALAVAIATSNLQRSPGRLVGLGTLIGLLYASNSWDAPAGALVAGGALALIHRRDWRGWLISLGWLTAGAAVAALPFVLTFNPPVGADGLDVPNWVGRIPVLGTAVRTFGIVDWRPSSVRELLLVHGAWIAVLLGFVARYATWREVWTVARRRSDVLMVGGLLSVFVAIVWAPAVVVLGWPLAVAALLGLGGQREAVRAVAGLFALGLLLALLPEFFYIQDAFGDRMNTVFKLYFQAWLLLSVASGAALALLFAELPRPALRAVPVVATAALLAVTLPYVWLSAQDWSGHYRERMGLDGARFIARLDEGDAAAIEWVRGHANAGDTLVEAPGCSYGVIGGVPMNRVSAFTGVPTVIGWDFHEVQWRRGDEEFGATLSDRLALAAGLLDGTTTPAASGVAPRFLVLGRQEVLADPGCRLTVSREDADARLVAVGWRLVFDAGGTRVYEWPGNNEGRRSVDVSAD